MPAPASPPAPLAVTCGDPSGIGPELAARIAAEGAPAPMVWIGDPRHLPADTRWQAVETPSDPVPRGVLAVLPLPFAGAAVPGRPDPANAAGTIAAIARAVALVQAGACSGVVTAPINKKALKDGAGFAFPGHTEFLAHLAGGVDVVMMLACPGLRVVPTTIHIPLAEVPAALTPALLARTIAITRAALIRDFGLADPRIAVAGLNPHAGEGGAMGTEESRFIAPLIRDLQAQGVAITGPLPADTLFHPAARARYDAAICMYHDQALIPIKTIDFAGGVNVTLGLPFVRTSPDHGTAYDIAGRGIADPASMRAALVMAWEMAEARRRAHPAP
ncbi:MAG: 4-hydroxythreonine-4-phosphate dehydrogenase PdxA [Rhodobacter sp.]|uniref:4-hydroxythreonine-4-phosphate dehydrogenase PdxA n=1 Tax=Pararhodobacter sp. TaxID=2127056 RepID=UPI002C202A6F|nr:4-hydroxythreonine-4-phosphate dehydrogenase PdxA [Pararhodobacter sp.]MCC0074158.1 4-hydroxythreonine-4-phosphate dehydrogenase PdxA [Rhodobacter sp.]HPD92954.1 4-hydroxythreonine-4-phosphate dehydrogenase PdxA [Pararhodobacter sp.]